MALKIVKASNSPFKMPFIYAEAAVQDRELAVFKEDHCV
jgi:hypothetical protein